jgi:hypothetical protein
MQSSGISYDPFLILGEYLGQSGYRNTTGRTRRSLAINSSDSTLVLINAGQSNATNILPSAVTLTNGTVIDNFNVYDGGLYDANGRMMGTDIGGQGTVVQYLADLLITNGRFDRVIVAPLAISGTPISVWADGGVLADRIPLAMRRLASRGIVPGMTGVTFALLWMQGEADNSNGTTQSAYQTAFGRVKANAIAAGFSGRIFVTTETWDAGTTSSAIQAAQAAVRDNVTVFDGGNLDSLGNTYRQDTTHFNDTGGASAATLIEAAMHASGAPF